MVLPSGVMGAAGGKLDIGYIGMGGQVQGHVARALQLGENVVAMCDVDSGQISNTKKRHGEAVAGATVYGDYRELFEREKSMDAVVIATPDHWHAPICRAAIAAGKHVYCEKPLTHTVAEARELRTISEAAKSQGIVTQTGNQGSASTNLRRSLELIGAGLFGEISEIHVWHPAHNWPSGEARPGGTDAIPEGLNWDFWLGTAPVRGYKPGIYHPGKWRGWYDFGNGSLGDFCCHGFNLPVRALGLGYPERIEVSGTGMGKESFARSCTVTFHFAGSGERGPVRLVFYSGGDLPPEGVMGGVVRTFGSVPRTGCLMVGSKGELSAGLWNSDCYVRLEGEKKFMGEGNHEVAKAVAKTVKRAEGGHFGEWVDACKGEGEVFADFEHGGHLTEIGLAGIVALKLQKDIAWDGGAMEVVGEPGAAALVSKENRGKWL